MGRGRPQIGPAINLHIPPDLVAELDRVAGKGGRSALIRAILTDWVEQRKAHE